MNEVQRKAAKMMEWADEIIDELTKQHGLDINEAIYTLMEGKDGLRFPVAMVQYWALFERIRREGLPDRFKVSST